jgi:isopenicillin N synthase-like dioxygenase
MKGSYYATVVSSFLQDQCTPDCPPELEMPNVWPPSTLLPGFRESLEKLCTLIIDVALPVARACDRFATVNVPEYEPGALERVVQTSRTHRARLLHYFPPGQQPQQQSDRGKRDADDEDDDWCALHIDDGCLTGLTSALFADESDPLPILGDSSPSPLLLTTWPQSPDPLAGLYIRSRTGAVTKVNIPSNCLAFQTGESLELMTRGKLKAVPHFVRGPSTRSSSSIARNTLALFMQPNLNEVVDYQTGMTFGEFTKMVDKRHA